MIPKARLGKRSPLGALVTSAYQGAQAETGESAVTMAAGQHATSRADGHLGLKVRRRSAVTRCSYFRTHPNDPGVLV